MFNQLNTFSREQIYNFRHFVLQNRQNIELITSRLLLATGFKLHLCGTKFLHEAICYCYRLPTASKISLSGTVYPLIAQKFKTTPRNVGKDIRTAIQAGYQRGSMFIINDICGYEMFSQNYPPTNSEFIVQVAEWLKTLVNENTSYSVEISSNR